MAGNSLPLITRKGNIGYGTITTANTALDGTGTVVTVFTADATNGSYIEKVNVRHLGTNVATVIRLFLNNGSASTTASNNILYTEIAVAANTLTQNGNSIGFSVPLGFMLPAGWKVNATIGTTVAAGLGIAINGGDY
jgi:hypothetical protein